MRSLALDIGDKTIGIAASDLLNITAQGVKTIKRTSNKEDLRQLGEIISEYDAEILVIGYPKNMNGTEGERCEIVKKFAEKISNAFPNVKQVFWDERLSTVAAEKNLIAADVSRAKRKKVIDKMAAVYILQGWLDSNQKGSISVGRKHNQHKDFENEENFEQPNFENEQEDFFDEDEDIIIEMTDEDGNTYYYSEEMIIPVGEERFAILVEVQDEEEEHHCHCGECGDEDCDCGDIIIAKIVLNEDGEEEYIEPTDEEFEAVQDAYEKLIYEAEED